MSIAMVSHRTTPLPGCQRCWLPGLALVGLAIAQPGVALAANLVPNGDFDAGAAGWSLDASEAQLVHAANVDLSPTSPVLGGLELAHQASAAVTTISALSDCFAVDELESYYLAASELSFVQATTGSIAFELVTYDDVACAGNQTATDPIASPFATGSAVWVHRSTVLRGLAPGSLSARVRAALTKNEAGQSHAIYLDGFRVQPLSDSLVANGTVDVGGPMPWGASVSFLDSLDAAGDPNSGSIRRSLTLTASNQNAQYQHCIDQPFAQGALVEFAVAARLETVPGEPGSDARFSVLPRSAPGCGGTTLSPFGYAGQTLTMDEFETRRARFEVPAGTESVTLLANVRVPFTGGGTFVVNFDDTVLFVPEARPAAAAIVALAALAAVRARRRAGRPA